MEDRVCLDCGSGRNPYMCPLEAAVYRKYNVGLHVPEGTIGTTSVATASPNAPNTANITTAVFVFITIS